MKVLIRLATDGKLCIPSCFGARVWTSTWWKAWKNIFEEVNSLWFCLLHFENYMHSLIFYSVKQKMLDIVTHMVFLSLQVEPKLFKKSPRIFMERNCAIVTINKNNNKMWMVWMVYLVVCIGHKILTIPGNIRQGQNHRLYYYY